jgi:hypothetical protein
MGEKGFSRCGDHQEMSGERHVGETRRPIAPPTQGDILWAYVYQMLPPRTARGTEGIRALVNEENRDAQRSDRNWTARLVVEQQVTHVLILTDTPELDREFNLRLEAKLKEMEVPFAITVPLPVIEQTGPDKEQ